MYNAHINIVDSNEKTVFNADLSNLSVEEKDALINLFFKLSSEMEPGDAVALIDSM